MTTNEAPEAAEIARAMSECMNLLFLFAAPRVMESVRSGGTAGLDDVTVLASLRRFLSHAAAVRARATAGAEDLDRLVRSAILVEEIAGELGRAGHDGGHPHAPGSPKGLPPGVVDRARQALSILGVPPPAGGWEAFEGFTLPYPAPPPSAP